MKLNGDIVKRCNLGVIMDSAMTMDNHIAGVKKCCYYYLRSIRDERPGFTIQAAKVLVYSRN